MEPITPLIAATLDLQHYERGKEHLENILSHEL